MIGNQINVGGVAIKAGVSKNGILYSAKELKLFSKTLATRPIIKDHRGVTDNTIGVVTNSSANSIGTVSYKGWIKEDGTGIIERVKDGRIKEVSIGAFVRQLVESGNDDGVLIAKGIEAMELSTTPVPAVNGTSLSQTLSKMEAKKLNETIKVLPIYEDVNRFEEENIEKESDKIIDLKSDIKEEKVEWQKTNKIKKILKIQVATLRTAPKNL